MYEDVFEPIEGKLKKTTYKAQNHSGFPLVVPAWKILDLLNSEKLAMNRKQSDEKIQQELDSNPVRLDTSSEEEVFTREGFIDDLKRASRKTSEPVSETKETSD